ncbi:MAG: transglutaminase family protein [Roseiflexaceae bacterium]|nr:transglutaminase family protein [Roseiflexaceae bacterium]
MDYTIRHITKFRYSAPVSESVMEVRMQPRREGPQQCLSFELLTNPSARVTSTTDYLGNIVHHFDLPRRHSELVITAQSQVSVGEPARLPAMLPAHAWVELDALAADGDYTDTLVPSTFAQPTALLRELARELHVARRDDPLTLLRQISMRLHSTLAYAPQSTRADSPIDLALELRQGVCQDYAHIMIALLRLIDVPARYVSGYLFKGGSSQITGADATHAWVEALIPGYGWVGMDPTNNTLVSNRHIRVAVGRDYNDVPPTRGVFKGSAETELGVAVGVVPADARGAALPTADDVIVMKTLSPPTQAGEQPEQQ